MHEENSIRKLRYLAFSRLESGQPKVTIKTTHIAYSQELPSGFAEIETLQAGACASEFTYYLRREDNQLSRHEQDCTNETKLQYYVERNMDAGLVPETINIGRLRSLLLESMFHEGSCRVKEVHLDASRKKIPVQRYIPKLAGDGTYCFFKEIEEVDFQEGFESGRLAIRNPGIICDTHSRADNINPKTGWPVQCNRNTQGGHLPKGTIGHSEFIGAAIEGLFRAPLDALTLIPRELQEFVEKDLRRRVCLLTAVEPLGCVFDAFGTMLSSGERPESMCLIGDGPNALNVVLFFQVFSPQTKILILGRYPEKLEKLKEMDPDTITTLVIQGEEIRNLLSMFLTLNDGKQFDVVMPTVPLSEDVVSPLVKDGGVIIWWAASISAQRRSEVGQKRYRERFPYGGAPRAELSATALLEFLTVQSPAVIDTFLAFPGVYYSEMGESAARDIQEWFEHKGKFAKDITLSRSVTHLTVKPIINMIPLGN